LRCKGRHYFGTDKIFRNIFSVFSAQEAPETASNAGNALSFNAFHAVKIVADFRACFIINIDDRVAFLSRIYSCNEETYRMHVTKEQEEKRPRHGKLTTKPQGNDENYKLF